MGDKKQRGTLPGFSRQSMSELNDDEVEFVNSYIMVKELVEIIL